MDKENRRLKKINITNELLVKLLNNVLHFQLPKDSLVVEVTVNHEHDSISLILHSDKFDPLLEGESVI